MAQLQICDEYNATRKDTCGRMLDSHGSCDRADEHSAHPRQDRRTRRSQAVAGDGPESLKELLRLW
jgi:hypothetical protein